MITTIIVRYTTKNETFNLVEKEWYHLLLKANEQAEGFLDRTELPIVKGDRNYSVVLRFKDKISAEKWLNNPERKQLIEKANLEEVEQIKSVMHHNQDFWFAQNLKIKKWKQVILSFVAVYPLTILMPKIVQFIFSFSSINSLIIKGILVSIFISISMVYVMMPFVMKLFKKYI